MLDFETFREKLITEAEYRADLYGGKAEIKKITKADATEREGITMCLPGKAVCPVMYIDSACDAYMGGAGIEDIIDILMGNAEGETAHNIESAIKDKETASKNLRTAITPVKGNKDWLKNCPNMETEDLAVYAVVLVEGGAVKCTRSLAEYIGLSDKEILDTAMSNTRAGRYFVEIGEMLGMGHVGGPELMVLTTEGKYKTAALMADPAVLAEIKRKHGGNFYILPSSVHEALTISKSEGGDPENLKMVVGSVNEKEVNAEEYLSGHVYESDGESIWITA